MLVADSSIECWGQGVFGQLGTGGAIDEFTPLPATTLNTGSANVELFAFFENTYVDL
jgi:hypothetical protein